MKKALSYIVSAIVDDPKQIKISEEETEGVVNFTVTVAKEDMGKIIGKNGKVIKAIRNVVKIPAIKLGKKIYISLSENPQLQV